MCRISPVKRKELHCHTIEFLPVDGATRDAANAMPIFK